MNVSAKFKNYLAERGIGYYLALPAIVFAVVAMCMYALSGVTDFNPELDNSVFVFMSVGAALMILSMAAESLTFDVAALAVRLLRYVAFLLTFFGFIRFIGTQATYIANVFVGIDGNTFTAGFLCAAVFSVLSFVLMLVAGCLSGIKPWHASGDAGAEGAEDEK